MSDDAWVELECLLTTKILPQYAAEITALMPRKNFRSLVLGAAAQNFDEKKLGRMVENILILNGVQPR